jgi:hypothetical protein
MLYQFFIDANDKDNKVSARALMILFAIGVIPLILGVDVTKINISIPWLMEVSIAHKDRFYLIYVAIILYSTYRFRLSNREIQRYCRLRSLEFFLENNFFGRSFISTFIFKSHTSPRLTVDHTKQGEEIKVTCNINEEDPAELPSYFYLTLNKYQKWSASVKHNVDEDHESLGISDLWQIDYDWICDPSDGRYRHSESSATNSIILKAILTVGTFVFSFRAAARDLVCLDYCLPVYCNIGLSIFLVWNYL